MVPGMILAVTVGEVAGAVWFWVLLGAPIIVTTIALLDAAKRPEWAWVMSNRRRILWLGILIAGVITYFPGPLVAAAYWLTARRDVRSIERGNFGSLD